MSYILNVHGMVPLPCHHYVVFKYIELHKWTFVECHITFLYHRIVQIYFSGKAWWSSHARAIPKATIYRVWRTWYYKYSNFCIVLSTYLFIIPYICRVFWSWKFATVDIKPQNKIFKFYWRFWLQRYLANSYFYSNSFIFKISSLTFYGFVVEYIGCFTCCSFWRSIEYTCFSNSQIVCL